MCSSFVTDYDAQEFRKCHLEYVGQLKNKHLLYPLVGEIDRCLKKVGEVMEKVEDIWQKLLSATLQNVQSQKEKHENDLKKEIKKLQKRREDIRAWISSTDIKDTTLLVDTKKLIEVQMERFKGLERELKTKAYSKVGLDSAPKVDPITQETEEIHEWICNWMDELEVQIDHYESEVELLLANKRMKGQQEEQDRGERLDQLQAKVERHKFHLAKLEVLIRMMDDLGSDVNYSASRIKQFLEEVRNIQDTIDYYLEANDDPDFQEDADIYDEIEGMKEFEQSSLKTLCINNNTSILDESNNNLDGENPGLELSSSSSSQNERCSSRNEATTEEINLEINFVTKVRLNERKPDEAVVPKVTISEAPPPTFGAVSPSFKNALCRHISSTHVDGPSKREESSSPPPKSVVAGTIVNRRKQISPSLQDNPPKSESASPCPFSTSTSGDTSRASPKEIDLNSNFLDVRNEAYQLGRAPYTVDPQCQPAPQLTSLEGEVMGAGSMTSFLEGLPNPMPVFGPFCPATKEAMLPPLLLAAPLGTVPLTDEHRQQFKILEAAEFGMPKSSCMEKIDQLLPRQAWQAPSYYPQVPLSFSTMEAYYRRFENSTLFYIFYTAERSMAQHLAAKVLKSRSWRFHKKYLVWFQRFEEPIEATDTYEYGSFIYFNIDKWAVERKDDFYFEYCFLEDEV